MQARERKVFSSGNFSSPMALPLSSTMRPRGGGQAVSPKSKTPVVENQFFFKEEMVLPLEPKRSLSSKARLLFFCVAGALSATGLLFWSYSTVVASTSGDERRRQPSVEFCPGERTLAKRVGIRFVGPRPVDDWPPTCLEAKVDAGQCFGGGSSFVQEETSSSVSMPRPALRCLPSFIIAGAQKAATGWLRQWLREHPDLAQGGDHEIHYFDKLVPLNNNQEKESSDDWPFRDYLEQFPSPHLRAYTYEKTPDYLPNVTAMRSIFSLMPSTKLIFMLRDPSSRAYSAFQHHCRRGRFAVISKFTKTAGSSRLRPAGSTKTSSANGREIIFELESDPLLFSRAPRLSAPCRPIDFDAFVRKNANSTRLVNWGYYAKQLEDIRRVGFNDDQLYVAFSETALHNPDDLLDDLVEWLGLRRFDFAQLPTFKDALGRTQLRQPGVPGFFNMIYLQYNGFMFYRHSSDAALPTTTAFLNDLFRQPNRDLDRLLLKTAPGVAVFPPRKSDSKNRSATLLPPKWAI